jgi:hypothetical protein
MGVRRYSAAKVIEAIQGSFGIKTVIATRLGCTRGTVDNYIARYPTVEAAWHDERGRLVDMAQASWSETDAGQDWAVRYVLSTLGKNDGFSDRVELTGAEGEPLLPVRSITINMPSLPDDEAAD